MITYYKLKSIRNHWFVLFEKDGEKTFIYDDIESLKKYFDINKDCIFVGGDNYYSDNFSLALLLKNGDLFGEVDFEEVLDLLPLSLDVTQEIVRSNDVKLDTCLLNMNRKVFNYNISDDLSDEDLRKVIEELTYKVDFIKELYFDRKDYFDWRLGLLSEFDLPNKYVTHSKGRLMEDIVSFNGNKIDSTHIDKNLQNYVDEMPELQELISKLSAEDINGLAINFGSTTISIGGQGLKDGLDKVVDTTGDNNYLYIDFNSFGPSIIINNGWLNDIADYPERYEQLRDRRIKLKGEKENSQKYYKRLINSFIDCFCIKESLGYNPNISRSVVINGVVIMYLLYKQIEKLGVRVIEVNTDGMIIKCPRENNDMIKSIASLLCKNLNMSCDVDLIKKIAHRNTQSYCVEFEDGSVKKIGVFGKMEDDLLQTNSKRYLSECLLNYYLNNDNDIMEKLKEIASKNDPTVFQEILHKSSKTGQLYMIQDSELLELTSSSNRVVVVKDESRNPIFKRNAAGKIVPYNSKVNYELVNEGLNDFDISRLDLNYYFGQVKKNIEATSGKKVVMLDIDGTLVEDLDKEKVVEETLNKMKIKVCLESKDELYRQVGWAYLSFMSACKKEKGYGTVDNFAIYCKERCSSILGDIDYKKFAETYFKVEAKLAESEIKVFPGLEEGIQKLRCQGYDISIYTNGMPLVQKAKLKQIPFLGKIVHMGNLANSYAKSSKKGFLDQVEQLRLDSTFDTVIMVGNGSSDLPPKTLNIPTYILLNGRSESELSRAVRKRVEKEENVSIVEDMVDLAKVLLKKTTIKNI